MFLTIQLVHWLVGKIAHNRLQEKKDETCFEEQVVIAQEIIQNEEWCLGCSIYKFRHAVDGNIVGYKAIFVARGFSRKEGINYEETLAATRS